MIALGFPNCCFNSFSMVFYQCPFKAKTFVAILCFSIRKTLQTIEIVCLFCWSFKRFKRANLPDRKLSGWHLGRIFWLPFFLLDYFLLLDKGSCPVVLIGRYCSLLISSPLLLLLPLCFLFCRL